MAGGRTWAGLFCFCPGLGIVDGVRMGGNGGGSIHTDVGSDVATGLVGFWRGLGMVDSVRMGGGEGSGVHTVTWHGEWAVTGGCGCQRGVECSEGAGVLTWGPGAMAWHSRRGSHGRG